MAEKSKFIGELGEDLGSKFIAKFGWSKCCDWNFDFECQDSDHKTEKKKQEKSVHGIDGVYKYIDPYSKETVCVVVEAKAISWQKSDGKTKTESTIGTELNKYLTVFQQKLSCARKSEQFREIANLKDGRFSLKGLIVYFVHQGFGKKVLEDVLKNKIALPSGAGEIPIFICANDYIEVISTGMALLNKKGTGRVFFYPDLERPPNKVPATTWSELLTLESIFSTFVVAKVKTSEKGEDEIVVLYRGDYSHDSLSRLFAAFGRLQLYSHAKLGLAPVREPAVYDDRHAFVNIRDGELITIEGRDVSITLEQVEYLKAVFTLAPKD